ncbi:MAG: hypothetical protein ACFFAY_14010 [Promethearchaeota archaeon]
MPLVEDEAAALAEIENIIGEAIPKARQFGGASTSTLYRTAYRESDGRIKYLSIHDKGLASLPSGFSDWIVALESSGCRIKIDKSQLKLISS